MQDDLFSVELLVNHHIHIVSFFFNVNRHIHTFTSQVQRNRLRVVLILKEQSQVLIDFGQLGWHERELNLSVRVTIDFGDSLEAYGRNEFVEDDLLCSFDIIIVFGELFGGEEGDRTAFGSLNVDLG